MSAQDGLASLKIDRTRGRSRRVAFKIIVGVILAALLLLAVSAAPKWAESYFGVDVAVARVTFLDTGKGELSAAGYVVADRMSVLAFKGTGRLLKLNVVESQNVAQNEIIAEIDHLELDAAIAQSQAELKEAETDIQHMEALTAQAEAGAVQAEAGAANARAEVALSKSPIETIDSEVREIQVKLTDARRRYERDKNLAAENAISRTIVDDELTEIRLAETQIETSGKRKRELEHKIAVAETQAAMAETQVATAKSAVVTARTAAAVSAQHVKSMAARIGVLKAQLTDSMIFSPFDGVVIEKAAEVGEIVAPISIGGEMARGSIATIAERKSLQAEVDVAEQYISKVKVGQRASISIEAFPDMALPGKVLRILPRANRGKATVQVRVTIDKILEHPDIRPDMNLRVKFLPDDAPPGAETNIEKKLAVPKAALQGPPEARYVWIVKDGIAEKSAVVVGDEKNDTVEIKNGVKEGQTVVVKGAENIKTDKQKVKVADEK